MWLSIALAALVSAPASGQAPPPDTKKAAPKADTSKGAAPGGGATKGAVEPAGQGLVTETQTRKRDRKEIYKDPRIEKALANTFEELRYPSPRTSDRDISRVEGMAAGKESPDAALIGRVVDSLLADLTNRAHIKAVVDPDPKVPPTSSTARGLERAATTLMGLYQSAVASKNQSFLSIYIGLLNRKLPPLINHQLHVRIEASILLATVAQANSVPFFTALINDPNQLVWVKLWAARGITNATNEGKTFLDVVQGRAAAAAMIGFLGKEPEAPWPVKVRMFEAIGSVRLASTTGPGGKPDIAATSLRFVVDPEMRIEARAWAAWSIGMIQIPTQMTKYNFALEAYHIGRLAADLGDRIGAEYDTREASFAREADQARLLTSLLLYQVYPSLGGMEGVRDSGLLNMKHPALASDQVFLRGLDEQIKNVSRAAIDMLNAGGTQTKERRAALGTRVSALKAFLAQNVPADVELTPGGEKYPATPPQVAAGAPAR